MTIDSSDFIKPGDSSLFLLMQDNTVKPMCVIYLQKRATEELGLYGGRSVRWHVDVTKTELCI